MGARASYHVLLLARCECGHPIQSPQLFRRTPQGSRSNLSLPAANAAAAARVRRFNFPLLLLLISFSFLTGATKPVFPTTSILCCFPFVRLCVCARARALSSARRFFFGDGFDSRSIRRSPPHFLAHRTFYELLCVRK